MERIWKNEGELTEKVEIKTRKKYSYREDSEKNEGELTEKVKIKTKKKVFLVMGEAFVAIFCPGPGL